MRTVLRNGIAAALVLPGLGMGVARPSSPIKHVVVIYQENVSFDHYFGTYPQAANTSGQPFVAKAGTPAVNGLNTPAPGGGTLLTNNPNGANPRRLDPANVNDVLTCTRTTTTRPSSTPDWPSTAVIIAYDDSDGFYDHAYSGVTNPSQTVADALTGPGVCGTGTPLAGEQGRCGYGPRMPLIVISPWTRSNYVDHSLTNQASILRSIEDNFGLGRITGSADATSGSLVSMFDFGGQHVGASPLLLDPSTGQPLATAAPHGVW